MVCVGCYQGALELALVSVNLAGDKLVSPVPVKNRQKYYIIQAHILIYHCDRCFQSYACTIFYSPRDMLGINFTGKLTLCHCHEH